MKYYTVGKEYYKGYKVELVNIEKEAFDVSQWANIYKLVLISEGAGIIECAGIKTAFAAPCLICINNVEKPQLLKSDNLKARSVYFNPSVVNSVLNYDNIDKENGFERQTDSQDRFWLVPFYVREKKGAKFIFINDIIKTRVAALMDVFGKQLEEQPDEGWPCRSRSYLIELLFIIKTIYDYKEFTFKGVEITGKIEEIEDIVLYLSTNYHRKLSIADLTSRFGTNRTTLTEKFSKIFGMPVMAYINNMRIQIAAGMLRDTMVPIQDIMYRVGFSDSAHFARMFKKYMDTSPGLYRKENYNRY